MASASVDPLLSLEHDHAELNALLIAVRELLDRGGGNGLGAAPNKPGAAPNAGIGETLASKLHVLCDGLLLHFAREEEGLFPFVAEHVPELGQAVRELHAAHDEICGAALRMAHALRGGHVTIAALRERFERFESAYSAHAHKERDTLRRLAERLSAADRAALQALIEGL